MWKGVCLWIFLFAVSLAGFGGSLALNFYLQPAHAGEPARSEWWGLFAVLAFVLFHVTGFVGAYGMMWWTARQMEKGYVPEIIRSILSGRD